jgi:hypothetical protein
VSEYVSQVVAGQARQVVWRGSRLRWMRLLGRGWWCFEQMVGWLERFWGWLVDSCSVGGWADGAVAELVRGPVSGACGAELARGVGSTSGSGCPIILLGSRLLVAKRLEPCTVRIALTGSRRRR